MRKVLLAATLLCAGCGVPPEVKKVADMNARIARAFVAQMDAGNTTRDEEQAFVRVTAEGFQLLLEAIDRSENTEETQSQ